MAGHPLVQGVLCIAQFTLDGLGQIRIVDEDAELDVALLGAPREVRARNEQEPVIHGEEFCVVADVAAVEELGAQHGRRVEVCGQLPGGKDHYEDDRRSAERLLAVVPDAQAAARVGKNFLARAVRFLLEEAGISQVRCRDSGRSSRARLCGRRAKADTATDPSLWCDVTKDPYLGCGRA